MDAEGVEVFKEEVVNSLNMVGKDTPAFGHPSKRGEGGNLPQLHIVLKRFRAQTN